jgi:hypothetical protein
VGEELGLRDPRIAQVAPVCSWPSVDLAAIRLPGLTSKGEDWDPSVLPIFTPVRTSGYAFGMNQAARQSAHARLHGNRSGVAAL